MRHKKEKRSLKLESAPMDLAPHNELGVVFLFCAIAPKLQLRVSTIQAAYPDCLAYRYSGRHEEKVRIEFEFHSSNFKAHKHDPRMCDMIVCWHHDWADCPDSIEVVELKKHFGVSPKVWIQPSVKSQWPALDTSKPVEWALSKHATPGDLLLMYRNAPRSEITDIYEYVEGKSRGDALWREGTCVGGTIRFLAHLEFPVHFDDLTSHRVLKSSSFVSGNMQGNLHATPYWMHLHTLIVDRNPGVASKLKRWNPDNL